MPASDAPRAATVSSRPPIAPSTRRARPIYRVFVSSTWLDLQPERRALMDALNRMEEMRFVGMEFFGNRPDDTHDASIDQVDQCELFVGIIGHRYGSGITEAEYRRARELGLPCFAYFKRDDTSRPELTDGDPALAEKLAVFKQDLRRDHTVKEFTTPDELAASATADLHNWVAARWISLEREATAVSRAPIAAPPDADRTNVLRLLERIEQDWIEGVLEASLHHKAWLELGLDWREDAVEHPWDRIVVAPNRPIKTLSAGDSITGVFDAAQHTLLVLGEPGAGKTTTVLELARDLVARARASPHEPAPVVLALSTWRGAHKDFSDWIIAELGLRYQVPKRVAQSWLEGGRLVLLLDGLDEVALDRRAACVDAINAFEQAHHPPGLAVTCRVAEYDALTVKLRLRAAICLQPLTPAQIDRYFAAAGSGLDHLRLAMRDDAGLRELARSPLMLSVMAMAWRDAPAITAREQGEITIEERRRQLFDAYVQAAMNRRGKATGGYSAEQTVTWLTWLACRMKEHGHTLFAVEQLQPGWLNGTWRQFGYFVATRLLGTVGLALPFLVFNAPLAAKASVAAASVALGVYIGVLDFSFARHGWGGARRAALRFWTLFAGLATAVVGWGAMSAGVSAAAGIGVAYLLVAAFAFCAPLDVRALDIKPTGSIQWSWRLALRRGLLGLVLVNAIVTIVFLIEFGDTVRHGGWSRGLKQFGEGHYFSGLAIASVLVAIGWATQRPARNAMNVALAITLALVGGQIGGVISFSAAVNPSNWSWEFLLAEAVPATLFGVFSGFASTLIDPARPQQAGVWFWLRVPVLAFLVVGLVTMVPGVITVFTFGRGVRLDGDLGKAVLAVVAVGAGCGLVAFLRFGGFNGAQHFLLRWQLARSGHLPPKPEAFFNHAAQLALMQKVGLGFRFVHALLLEHLAVTKGGAAARGAAEHDASALRPDALAANEPTRFGRARTIWRIAMLSGLGGGFGLLGFGIVVAVLSRGLGGLSGESRSNNEGIYVGAFFLMLSLAIPVVLLGGRWLWRRSWPWLAGGYLALAVIGAYLATDDPEIRRPMTLQMIAPAFPDGEKSYAVLSRYRQQEPAVKNFARPQVGFPLGPEQPIVWQNYVTRHRAEIEAGWTTLAPVREWMAELNAFERIADLSETMLDPDAVATRPVETYAYHAMAIATLQALDGDGNAALATLRPLLEVGGKWEVSSRGFRHYNHARRMQGWAISAALFTVNHATVSPAARAAFDAVLVARGGGPAGMHHYFALQYAEAVESAPSFGQAVAYWTGGTLNFMRWPLEGLGPIVFNRRATLNRYGELFTDLAELGAQRDHAKARERVVAFLAPENRPLFKNLGGAWLNDLTLGVGGARNAEMTIRRYWAIENGRAELHAALTKP